MVYAKFGGQTECIMGNWTIENTSSDYEAFPYVLSDLLSGLNHATRRQSARMPSYHVVWSLKRHGKAQ